MRLTRAQILIRTRIVRPVTVEQRRYRNNNGDTETVGEIRVVKGLTGGIDCASEPTAAAMELYRRGQRGRATPASAARNFHVWVVCDH